MYYYWCGVNYFYSLAMLVVAWKVIQKYNGQRAYYVGNTLAFLMHQAGNIYMIMKDKGTWKTNEFLFAKVNMTLTNNYDV